MLAGPSCAGVQPAFDEMISVPRQIVQRLAAQLADCAGMSRSNMLRNMFLCADGASRWLVAAPTTASVRAEDRCD